MARDQRAGAGLSAGLNIASVPYIPLAQAGFPYRRDFVPPLLFGFPSSSGHFVW
jgi:hypothetical protein